MRVLVVIALLLGLLILLGMSFLRINNLEYDVRMLAKEVERLKAGAAAAPVAHRRSPRAAAGHAAHAGPTHDDPASRPRRRRPRAARGGRHPRASSTTGPSSSSSRFPPASRARG